MNSPIIAWLGQDDHYYQVHESGQVLHVVLHEQDHHGALLNLITLPQMESAGLQRAWNNNGVVLQPIDEDVFNDAFERACKRLGILPITNYQKKA
jgi:hypothetical protein